MGEVLSVPKKDVGLKLTSEKYFSGGKRKNSDIMEGVHMTFDGDLGTYKLHSKCALIGSIGCGKSSIILRYVRGDWSDLHESTIGANFVQEINVSSLNKISQMTSVSFDLIDTAGAFKFSNMIEIYYKECIVIMLIFDVNNMNTYNRAIWWYKDISQKIQKQKIFFLVGNKCDHITNKEQYQKISEKRKSFMKDKKGDISYIETSAKSGKNIDQLFTNAGNQLRDLYFEIFSIKFSKNSSLLHGSANRKSNSLFMLKRKNVKDAIKSNISLSTSLQNNKRNNSNTKILEKISNVQKLGRKPISIFLRTIKNHKFVPVTVLIDTKYFVLLRIISHSGFSHSKVPIENGKIETLSTPLTPISGGIFSSSKRKKISYSKVDKIYYCIEHGRFLIVLKGGNMENNNLLAMCHDFKSFQILLHEMNFTSLNEKMFEINTENISRYSISYMFDVTFEKWCKSNKMKVNKSIKKLFVTIDYPLLHKSLDLRNLDLISISNGIYKPLFSTIKFTLISTLDLRKSNLNDIAVFHLCKNVPSSLETLVLFYNQNITTYGAIHIANYLLSIKRTSLKHLNIALTSIGNEGVKKLLMEIMNNKNCVLENLNISDNNLTDSIGKYIVQCIGEEELKLKELTMEYNSFTNGFIKKIKKIATTIKGKEIKISPKEIFEGKEDDHDDIDIDENVEVEEKSFKKNGQRKSMFLRDISKCTSNIRFFDWDELMKMTDLTNPIGEGTFGRVYLSHIKGKKCALKLIMMSKSMDIEEELESYKNEITILSRLHHPYVIRIVGISEKETEINHLISIVTEYCPGSIRNGIFYQQNEDGTVSKKKLKFTEKCEFLLQIAEAMNWLHEKSIWHRDLKWNNVIVDLRQRCKLIDFGFARKIDKLKSFFHTAKKGTWNFIAPEVFEEKLGDKARYDSKCDVWSFGIMLWCIFYCNDDPYNVIERRKNDPFFDASRTIPLEVCNGKKPKIEDVKDVPKHKKWFIKLINQCLMKDPSKRPSFDKIVEIFEKNML